MILSKKGKYKLLVLLVLIIAFQCSRVSKEPQEESEEPKRGSSFWLQKYEAEDKDVQTKKDYLLNAYRFVDEVQNDSIKKSLLSDIAFEFLNLKEDSLFEESNGKILEFSNMKSDSVMLARYYSYKGIFFSDKEVLDSAYYYFSKAEKVFNNLGDQYRRARLQYNSAFVLRRSKSFVQSEVLAVKAARIFESIGKKKNLYQVYNHLGLLYNDLGRYDIAVSYHEKAKKLINSLENPYIFKERTLNNLSLVYQKQGKYDEAISVLDEALENKELDTLNRNLYAKLLDNRAYNRFLKGDTTGVRKDFEYAKQIREELENDAGQAISHLHLARLDLKQGDTLNAYTHSKRAYSLAVDKGFNRDILESLQLLSKTDTEHSTQYMDEYIALNDKLVAEERNGRDKFARVQYETEGYIAENRDLQKKNIWIIMISALILSAGLFFFVIFRQRSRNKRLQLENEQQEANEEIYNLMLKQQNRMEEGRVQERVRISEELHDGVLARLFGIRMGMGFLNLGEDEQTQEKYQYYMEEMQGAEQEIRALSHALKDDELSARKDFPLLLKELLIEQARVGGFNHKFVHDPDIAWDRIPDKIKINLYRIAQEALHNVIKYASCQSVEVSIRKIDKQVEMRISDDGNGFVMKKRSRGIGLKNMQSRSKQIGADLSIRSQPDQGTTIKINIQTKRIYDDREI